MCCQKAISLLQWVRLTQKCKRAHRMTCKHAKYYFQQNIQVSQRVYAELGQDWGRLMETCAVRVRCHKQNTGTLQTSLHFSYWGDKYTIKTNQTKPRMNQIRKNRNNPTNKAKTEKATTQQQRQRQQRRRRRRRGQQQNGWNKLTNLQAHRTEKKPSTEIPKKTTAFARTQ